jgi:hypothetical protein
MTFLRKSEMLDGVKDWIEDSCVSIWKMLEETDEDERKMERMIKSEKPKKSKR